MQEVMRSTPSYRQAQELKPVHGQYLLILQQANTLEAQHLADQFAAFPTLLATSEAFLDELTAQLQQARAGLHVVVCGDEIFLWQVTQSLMAQGLMKDEIELIQTQPELKKVYCVHCGELQTTTAEDFYSCEHCGVYLLVRTHFSERLGAYMGVCANPDQPMQAEGVCLH
ncbi:dimethylamine monooxygenase subunit DmmA family protein [Acinetobacter sp. ANC 4639]